MRERSFATAWLTPSGRPAAVHRSKLLCSNPARVPPPLRHERIILPQSKKPTIGSVFQSARWVGIDSRHPWRAASGRPGGLSCPPVEPEPEPRRPSPDKTKWPVTRQAILFYLAVREGFEPSIRCRIHTFQACSFSHSDTSPNFGLLFNVLSQHGVRCAVALERGVI